MNQAIHELAAKGFSIGTDSYEKGRPEYPVDAVDFLISELKLNNHSHVVDLGAGTGKLTRMLRKTGAKITAVEPVKGMRKKFSTILPMIEIVDGMAERIPLASASVDAVVVAQAFHWFKGEAALQEIHRILKPGGKLGLIWNFRDETVPWVSKLTNIIDPYENGAPRYMSGEWTKAFETTVLFSKPEYTKFGFIQKGDVNMVTDRVASISFIAALPDAEKEKVLKKVQELARSAIGESSGQIEFPYRTDVFVCAKN